MPLFLWFQVRGEVISMCALSISSIRQSVSYTRSRSNTGEQIRMET